MDEDTVYTVAMIASWFLFSFFLGEWVTDNYYIIETVALLLIFGLLYEAWVSSGGKNELVEAVMVFADEIGRTGAQLLLIVVVGGFVWSSMLFRDTVEYYMGPLAVVQLLAFIMVFSRAFINIRSTGNPLELVDGTRETYLIYTIGILGISLSYLVRDWYHPADPYHNGLVIFLSTVPPYLYYYKFTEEKGLPSLKDIVGRKA